MALALVLAGYVLAFRVSQAELPNSRVFAVALLLLSFALPLVACVLAVQAIRENRNLSQAATGSASWPSRWSMGVLVLAVPFVAFFGLYVVRALGRNAEGRTTGQAWTHFSSSAGDFTILFPAAPTESSETVQRAGGTVTLRSVAAATGPGEGYSVMIADAPEGKDDATKTTLDRLEADFVAHSHGTVLAHADVLAGTVPGREVRVSTTESSFRVRLYRANGRIYQVLVIHRPSSVNEGVDDRFLGSFTLNGS